MIIYDYKPNGYGADEFYDYTRCSGLRLINSKNTPSRIYGWRFSITTLKAQSMVIVIYGENDRLYIDCGENKHFELTSNNINIIVKSVLNFTHVSISDQSRVVTSFGIFTPPWRYLTNDGMFPDDVEPIISVFKQINNTVKCADMAKKLSSGIGIR